MSAADEVVAASRRRADAMAAGDADALWAMLHPEFSWTSHRGDRMDRDRYVAGNTSGLLRWLGQQLDDVRVAVVGESAVLTCTVSDEVDRGEGPEVFRMPMTQTWVRESGGWLLLAGHAGPRLD